MTLKERAIFCVFISGFFSKPKLERVCGLPFDELVKKVPEVLEFQNFNIISNRELSLNSLKRMGELAPAYRGVFEGFLHSSFFYPSEFLVDVFSRVGSRLRSVRELDIKGLFGG